MRGRDALTESDNRLPSQGPDRTDVEDLSWGLVGTRRTLDYLPLEPHDLRDGGREVGDCVVLTAPDVKRFIAGVVLDEGHAGASKVVQTEELAPRRPAPPERDGLSPGPARPLEAVDARRQGVRGLELEVVTGSVELRRHRTDPTASELAPAALDVDEAGELRDRVAVFRRLKRTGHQRRGDERLWCETRVDAGRVVEELPVGIGEVGDLHDVGLDAYVVPQEPDGRRCSH